MDIKKQFDELREIKRGSSLKKRKENRDSLPSFGGFEDPDIDQNLISQSQQLDEIQEKLFKVGQSSLNRL